MTHVSLEDSQSLAGRHDRSRAGWVKIPGRAVTRLPWRLALKLGVGLALLGIGGVTVYQQLIVRTSREAVINARIVVIRAPMDGIVKAAGAAPGMAVTAGMAIGRIEDPLPDDSRAFQLQHEALAAARDADALAGTVGDLQRARGEADAQAEAYRHGRVRQDETRVAEAKAALAAAATRSADAVATEKRSAPIHQNGYLSDQAYERVVRAREVAQQDAVAAQKHLDGLAVELDAARGGTYLGDNYNDVPSSFQRARELTGRIAETRTQMGQLTQKSAAIAAELAAERQRLAARSSAVLSVPVEGTLWSVAAASGEYVRKGQELYQVLDCSNTLVTATVSERDYNELRIGDPVRFQVAGSGRAYRGTVSKLGLTAMDRSLAIPPGEPRQQVAVQLSDPLQHTVDRCAVGRSGELVFEDRGPSSAARAVAALRRFLGLA